MKQVHLENIMKKSKIKDSNKSIQHEYYFKCKQKEGCPFSVILYIIKIKFV